MKMKYHSILVFAAFLFAACTESTTDDSGSSGKNRTPVFSVSLSDKFTTRVSMNYDENDNVYKLLWEENDAVMIRSSKDESVAWSHYVAIPNEDPSKAILVYDNEAEPVEGATLYEAFYPSSMISNDAYHTITLPGVINGPKSEIPLYAQSSTTTLNFCGLCAVLQFRITPNAPTDAEITLLSASRKISGTCDLVLDTESGKHLLQPTAGETINEADKKISVSNPVHFENQVVVSFVLPAGTYSAQDLSLKIGEKTLTLQQDITLLRGVVKSFDLNVSLTPDPVTSSTEDMPIDGDEGYTWKSDDDGGNDDPSNNKDGSTEDMPIDDDEGYNWQADDDGGSFDNPSNDGNGSTEDLINDNNEEYNWNQN